MWIVSIIIEFNIPWQELLVVLAYVPGGQFSTHSVPLRKCPGIHFVHCKPLRTSTALVGVKFWILQSVHVLGQGLQICWALSAIKLWFVFAAGIHLPLSGTISTQEPSKYNFGGWHFKQIGPEQFKQNDTVHVGCDIDWFWSWEKMHLPLPSSLRPCWHVIHLPFSHASQPGGHGSHSVSDRKYPSLHKVQFCALSRVKPALHIHLFCSSHIPLTQLHSKIYKWRVNMDRILNKNC